MRCSWCEPLLDDFLEGTLNPRAMRDVARHVRRCSQCDGLLAELRVVDALLTTARAPGGVDSGFTAAVVSAAAGAPPAAVRRIPLWTLLAGYLLLAWTALGIAALRGQELAPAAYAFLDDGARGLAALGAAFRAVAPATGVVAAVVTGVLLLDLFLLAALVFGYRRLRPMLAVHLTRGERS